MKCFGMDGSEEGNENYSSSGEIVVVIHEELASGLRHKVLKGGLLYIKSCNRPCQWRTGTKKPPRQYVL
jgi:hypothetical protein